ncbi:MAG: type II toxin-antitoxin system RelE/ParE family toxin [Clostridiales bacterium]
MQRKFIYLSEFQKQWKDSGLNDDDLRELEIFLLKNTEAGDMIQGTGGVRKLRWKTKNSGKRGGLRTLYIDFIIHEKIYFLTAYSKKDKIDLSSDEKKIIKSLVDTLLNELNKKRK